MGTAHAGAVVRALKDVLDADAEGTGDLEGEQERGDILSRLEGNDGLSGHADHFSEGLGRETGSSRLPALPGRRSNRARRWSARR